jgi:hypothetical protein
VSPDCCSDLRFTSSILFLDGIADAAKGRDIEDGLSCLVCEPAVGGGGNCLIVGGGPDDDDDVPEGEKEKLVVAAGLKSVAFFGKPDELLTDVLCWRDSASCLSFANMFCSSLAGSDLTLSEATLEKMPSLFCFGACGFWPDPNGEKDFLGDDGGGGTPKPNDTGEVDDDVVVEGGSGVGLAPAEKGDHELLPGFALSFCDKSV